MICNLQLGLRDLENGIYRMSVKENLNIEELLRQNRDADLLRFTTAGSVDDGKSTLIGRMLNDCKCIYEDHLEAVEKDSKKLNRSMDLALLTDGLKAEREQGITIDVAYRYFSTPKRRFVIADTPGHEQYTRNMATGASTANLAVILIDARHGVLTQSKRHAFISSLLGIPHFVIAVNKMDLVDYSEEVFNRICKDFADFSAKLDVKDLVYIPISALNGDNVVDRSKNMPWYDGTTLLRHLETVHVGNDRNLIDFRFPVQYVNRPNLNFRGFCGTVASGVVRVGDMVMAMPSGKKSRVKEIVTFDGNVKHAYPPQSVTICLEDEIDISRGDMLVHPLNIPRLERSLEAMLVWMSDVSLKVNSPYIIKNTTNTVRGSFTSLQYSVDPAELHRIDSKTLELNQIGRVNMELFRPLICDEYARNRTTGGFIVIDPMSNATVAVGMIIHRTKGRESMHGGKDATPASKNITHINSLVTSELREKVLGHKAATIWLTGLSGSGKSAIGLMLEHRLIAEGHICYMLDGDNVRSGLNRDLGFSGDDRTENIRRIAEVAHLFNDAGVIVITSFISPYRSDRDRARDIIGPERFIETYVNTSLEVCEKRDPKGLYRKARAGDIGSFTGITAPYEAPEMPELELLTENLSVEDSVERIISRLKAKHIVS